MGVKVRRTLPICYLLSALVLGLLPHGGLDAAESKEAAQPVAARSFSG